MPYVLAVEYPEDAPRSMIIWNSGNETRRGFHTGTTLGDPRFLGAMTGNSMQRGFPQYVRAFNRAFLALPALPGVRLDGAASHPDVVVREIKTPKDGTWYAVINTGLRDAEGVRVKLAARGVADFFANRPVAATPLALYPGQVLVWHAAP